MTPMAVVYLGSDACSLKPTDVPTTLRPFDVDDALVSDLQAAHDASMETATARELCARVIETSGAGDVSERIADERIRDIVELVRSDPTSKHSAESLAARANVSPRRLSDLFRDEIGFPLRRYVVWMRLRLAIERVLSGGSLTEAAHSAGFVDLAHLSHAFRDMYGVSPSYALDPQPRPRLVLAHDP
jgi:transcriptional regulator GlxA family with amidase domain